MARGSLLAAISNRRGTSLIEVLIAAGGVALLGVAISTMVTRASQTQARLNLLSSVGILRGQFTSLLQNPSAWLLTVRNNKSMSCLANQTSCLAASQLAPQPFTLYSPSGTPFYNPSDLNAGFLADGAACESYGQPGCNIRLNLTWQPICANSPADPTCIFPTIRIQGAFSHSGPPSSMTNLSAYNISLNTFNGSAMSIAQLCIALGGTVDKFTQKCTLPYACKQVVNQRGGGGS